MLLSRSKRIITHTLLMLVLLAASSAIAGEPGVFKQVSAGQEFSCALQNSGVVYCWGMSGHGELGPGSPLGTNGHSSSPIQVTGFNGTVTAISSGDYFTCALLSNGQVWCWGGTNGISFGGSPRPVGGTWTAPATSISAKGSHACATLSDGSVKCWGDNWNYQLGLDANALTTKIGSTDETSDTIALTVPGVNNAVSVAAGRNHSCAVLREYVYYYWRGSFVEWQSSPVQCWGDDSWGQLGVTIPSGTYRHDTDELVNGSSNVNFEFADVFAYQANGISDALPRISGSDYTSCVVTASHGIYCWGGSGTGDTGNVGCGYKCPTGSSVSFIGPAPAKPPIAVSSFGMTSCGIYGQDIYCWGDNTAGLTRGINPYAYSPDSTLVGSVVTSVAVGGEHVCAVEDNGYYVVCWGHNTYGQLGPYASIGSNFAGPISVPIP
jgi:alpha-tubulin suppressor-like RCC1 family protein